MAGAPPRAGAMGWFVSLPADLVQLSQRRLRGHRRAGDVAGRVERKALRQDRNEPRLPHHVGLHLLVQGDLLCTGRPRLLVVQGLQGGIGRVERVEQRRRQEQPRALNPDRLLTVDRHERRELRREGGRVERVGVGVVGDLQGDANLLPLLRQRLRHQALAARVGGDQLQGESVRVPGLSQQLLGFGDVIRIGAVQAGLVAVAARHGHLVRRSPVAGEKRCCDRCPVSRVVQRLPHQQAAQRLARRAAAVSERHPDPEQRGHGDGQASLLRRRQRARVALAEVHLAGFHRVQH